MRQKKRIILKQEKTEAVVAALKSSPSMSAPECRVKQVVEREFGGGGVLLYLEALEATGEVYSHRHGARRQKLFYAMPEGWSCLDCKGKRTAKRKPSYLDPAICGRCELESRKAERDADTDRPNRMMIEWASRPIVSHMPYVVPSRYGL